MTTALTFAAEFALCYATLHLAAALVDVAVDRVTALDRLSLMKLRSSK
jgi:hypothetical protein